jgi:arylsulfatase A-like enzyme/Flp pilus assembly protein TadD
VITLRPTPRLSIAAAAALVGVLCVGSVTASAGIRGSEGAGTLPVAPPAAGDEWVIAEPASRSVPVSGLPSGAGALRGFNLLLVTVDTLRADVIGAYGGPPGLTPELDRLAAAGVRFSSAYAHAPMTLPSHASILTGEYPFRHGVRDNGTFRLDGTRVTLAEALRDAGYRTAAFVGAFVLDVRFGLSQGFDRYDDYYDDQGDAAGFHFAERRAAEVLEPAADWIQEGDGPWFAWVHLFDPHAPYAPPAPYLEGRRERPYEGEVAYVDATLGHFLEGLEPEVLERTLLVFTSDHGESLGEHGEQTHGAFAYNSTLHVPLIVWAGSGITAAVEDAPVGHVDVVPTVLDLLGLPALASVQGTSLVGSITAAADGLDGSPAADDAAPPAAEAGGPRDDGRALYFEALNGYFTQNLAPLAGVIAGGYKLIDLPVPELYDLSIDPQERYNLHDAEPAIASRLRGLLAGRLGVATPESGQSPLLADLGASSLDAIDATARRRLESLGYLTATALPAHREFTVADDPKSALPVIEKYRTATTSFSAGRPEEGIRLLREVVAARPGFTAAQVDLASMLSESGRGAEAIAVLEAALVRDPADPRISGKLGFFLATMGEPGRGVRLQELALEQAPDDVELLEGLGISYSAAGRELDARARLARAAQLDPSSASVQHNLGLTYAREGDFETAIAHFRRAIALAPSSWHAHEGLGSALALTQRIPEAIDAWKQLVELNPESYDALYNLGVVLADLRRDAEAIIYLDRFAVAAPADRYGPEIERVQAIATQVRARVKR